VAAIRIRAHGRRYLLADSVSNHHRKQHRVPHDRFPYSVPIQEVHVAKTYRTPTVAALGAAEVMTNAVKNNKLPHQEHISTLFTTVAVMDL
jgi:hypothetical protein